MRKTTTLDTLARQQIVTWLAASGLTQVEFGRQIGRNQAWVSRYLSGDFDADLDVLQRMAGVFGHTLRTLLGPLPTDSREATFISRYRACPPRVRRAIALVCVALTRK